MKANTEQTRLKRLLLSDALLSAARLLKQMQSDNDCQLGPGCFNQSGSLHESAVSLTMQLVAVHLARPSIADDAAWSAISRTEFSGLAFRLERMPAAFCQTTKLIKKIAARVIDEATGELEMAVAFTQVYESCLDFRIINKNDEPAVITINQAKKRNGQFYTPLRLAKKTAETALEQLLLGKRYAAKQESIKNLKILDPAMGAGVFLLCAMEFLEQWWAKSSNGQPTRRELANCIYGVDVDPLACQVASLALWLYCTTEDDRQRNDQTACQATTGDKALAPGDNSDPLAFTGNLRCADALLSTWSGLNAADAADACSPNNIFIWDQQFLPVFSPIGNHSTKTADPSTGFDVVLSNPPWELAKPNAQEFFSFSSPNFRKLSKQEAVAHTRELLAEQEELRQQWQAEVLAFEYKAKFIKKATDGQHSQMNPQMRPFFQAQGDSDLNVYKLFLDLGFSLLRDDGCLAMLVPSGVLVDKGAAPLRREFISGGRLFKVDSFVNSDRLFDIHSSFAYCLIGVQKGGKTESVSVSFGADNHFSYREKDISLLSPRWLTIFDVSHPKDLEVLKKIHSTGTALGAGSADRKAGWPLQFKREFDMTNDSHLFIEVRHAEADGFRPDFYGNWLKGKWQPFSELADDLIANNIVPAADGQLAIKIDDIEKVLLPLYEGRMIGQFDYSQKCHQSGSGRTAVWQSNPDRLLERETAVPSQPNGREDLAGLLLQQTKPIRPHYLIQTGAKSSAFQKESLKIGYLAVGSATNVRTMLASALHMVPCGNSVPTVRTAGNVHETLALIACLNSFVFDYALRMRMTGNNLNYFLLQECPLPARESITSIEEVARFAAALNLGHVRFARQWREQEQIIADSSCAVPASVPAPSPVSRSSSFLAASKPERLELRAILDALIADAYDLSEEEFSWILRGCDQETASSRRSTPALHAKGFWRADKSLPKDDRLPVAALGAYRKLRQTGRDRFLQACSLPVSQGENIRQATIKRSGRLATLDTNLARIIEIG